MTDQYSIEAFSENLKQDVLALAEMADEGMMLPDAFTQIALYMLSEAGEFDDPLVCYHYSRGMEVSGYLLDEDEGRLDVFLSIHTNAHPPETVPRQRVDVAFRRLSTFVEWCLSGGFVQLEKSSPVFDMATHIHSFRNGLTRIGLCVITDGRTTVETLPQDSLDGVPVSRSLWDIVRLHRLSTSGRRREAISIDLRERCGGPLPCLQADSSQEGYRAFLTLIPGDLLRDIYADYGTRLLERNVRSFLQARGKVNRGIRDTITGEPERFLAYNNGITITAESVRLCSDGGMTAITRLDGLQIVNGGQTTASLLAAGRGRADLSQVHVAAKLIEIQSGDSQDDLVRNVSRYANSQNRISEADFSANDPFHVAIEELSRTIWAPPASGAQRETRWFYERARGQYHVERAAEPTPARRSMFSAMHPPRQRFDKPDLAKFESTWEQLPHIVSRGAQKNFSDFMIRLSERGRVEPDRAHFERLVAKAILFRETERIVRRQNFGGYRANIVTYTIALLCNATDQRLDLERIWREQTIGDTLERVIGDLSHGVHAIITNPPNGRNITEWCKSPDCWDAVRTRASTTAVTSLGDEVMSADAMRRENRRNLSDLSDEYVENARRVVEIDSAGWQLLADWGAETDALDVSERQLASRIARMMRSGHNINSADARRAVEIIERADALGYHAVA